MVSGAQYGDVLQVALVRNRVGVSLAGSDDAGAFGLGVMLDGVVEELVVAGLHAYGAGAEEGLVLGHRILAATDDGRGEGGEGFGAEMGVAGGGKDTLDNNGAAGYDRSWHS